MSRQVDISKLLGRGYSTKRSTPIQVCLCRRCRWAAKVIDDGGTLERITVQSDRDWQAYTGKICCRWRKPNHSKVRDCYAFWQTMDSMPLLMNGMDGAGDNGKEEMEAINEQ